MYELKRVEAWKLVDAADAHYLEAGSLRLRSLFAYRQLENGRADPNEGRFRFESGVLSATNPKHRAMMANFGINVRVPEGHQGPYICGNTFTGECYDAYAFCFTEPGCEYDPRPEVPKAVFRIKDVQTLRGYLNRHLLSRAYVGRLGRVQYVPRQVTNIDHMDAEQARASPWIKDPRFEPEREGRIVFAARRGMRVESIIDTRPDYSIAALFERIS